MESNTLFSNFFQAQHEEILTSFKANFPIAVTGFWQHYIVQMLKRKCEQLEMNKWFFFWLCTLESKDKDATTLNNYKKEETSDKDKALGGEYKTLAGNTA